MRQRDSENGAANPIRFAAPFSLSLCLISLFHPCPIRIIRVLEQFQPRNFEGAFATLLKPLVECLMRFLTVLLLCVSSIASAQPAGKFPPDSLVNTKVIPHATPVQDVIGTMRN